MVKAFRNDALAANEDLSDDEGGSGTEDEEDNFNGTNFGMNKLQHDITLENKLVALLIAFSWSSKSLEMTH